MKISFNINNDDYSKFLDFTFKEAQKEEQFRKKLRGFRIIQYIFPLIVFIYALLAYNIYDTYKFLLILLKSSITYGTWVLIFEGIHKMDYYITKKKNLKNFQLCAKNIVNKDTEKNLITLELKDDRLIYNNYSSIYELSYSIIDKVLYMNDFILIKYYNTNSILIPLRAFKNQDEKQLFFKKLKELKEKSGDKLLKLNEATNTKIKLEYCCTEEELNKLIDLQYEYSTKAKKLFRNLNMSQIVLLIIIFWLLGFKNLIFTIFIGIFGIIVYYPKLKNKIIENYKNTLKKQFKNHNKTLVITNEYLINANSELIVHYKRNIFKNLLKLDEFLIGKKDDEFLFYIPNRIFRDKENKEKFIKLLNE